MNKADLISKLNQAKPFLMSQDFIPILTHFCFDKKNLTAYNDVAGINLVLDSDIDGAVSGNLMLKMLSSINAETVRISMKGSKNLQIASGASDVKLPLLPPDEFIFELPDTEDSELIKLPLTFLKGLEKTLISVGDDPLHPERGGVTWNITKNGVTLYSTDSRSLSIYEWEDDSLNDVNINVITPKFFCEQLISLAKNYSDELEHLDLYFNTEDNHVIADLNKICKIFTRLIISDSFTDYDEVVDSMMPDGDEMMWFDIPEELDSALERAIVISSANQLDDKKSYVTIADEIFNIRSESAYGRASDDIEFPAALGDFDFHLDPELLERSFKHTTKISVCPKLIVLTDDEKFTHLVSHSATT